MTAPYIKKHPSWVWYVVGSPISKILTTDRKNVLENAEPLFIYLAKEKIFSMAQGVIEKIGTLSKNDRPVIVKQAVHIIKRALEFNIRFNRNISNLLSMKKIPIERIEQILPHLKDLVDEKTKINEFTSILGVFSTLSDEQITNIKNSYLKWVLPLIAGAPDMDIKRNEHTYLDLELNHSCWGTALFLKAIADIPSEDHEDVLEKAAPFVKNAPYLNASWIIKAILSTRHILDF